MYASYKFWFLVTTGVICKCKIVGKKKQPLRNLAASGVSWSLGFLRKRGAKLCFEETPGFAGRKMMFSAWDYGHYSMLHAEEEASYCGRFAQLLETGSLGASTAGKL